MAEQRISLITLGSRDLVKSRRFYVDGFGWKPVFENDEIIFYQLNGVILSTFADAALQDDMASGEFCRPGAFALAHNVRAEKEVEALMSDLVSAGGRVLRPADAPPIGGLRGYVTDPDDHAWEIAYNPAFPIDDDGNIVFGT
ncbi:VOC family protein [Allopontixanthobacter sp.]|uniref:VOC family protein n=1 Tax=Allopontixanthobacter sp. TaxID=2906452 RepID=UPI002ABB3685|nr:VOC family protein [Allopontixanthobacter sp.]MDZ4307231.1 VOC family protein [Allopontixanthobacter sp.]